MEKINLRGIGEAWKDPELDPIEVEIYRGCLCCAWGTELYVGTYGIYKVDDKLEKVYVHNICIGETGQVVNPNYGWGSHLLDNGVPRELVLLTQARMYNMLSSTILDEEDQEDLNSLYNIRNNIFEFCFKEYDPKRYCSGRIDQ